MDRTEKMMQICKANEELGHQAMANAIVMAFPDATEEEIRGAIAYRVPDRRRLSREDRQ